jgi:hypothetical protein
MQAVRQALQERDSPVEAVENPGYEIDRPCDHDRARKAPENPRAKAHQPFGAASLASGSLLEGDRFAKWLKILGIHRYRLLAGTEFNVVSQPINSNRWEILISAAPGNFILHPRGRAIAFNFPPGNGRFWPQCSSQRQPVWLI